MQIYIAADHAGYERKESIKPLLKSMGYEITDFGAKNFDPKDDYPDFAHPLAKAVAKDGVPGIVLCGNAQGVCIVANKVDGVRAAYAHNVFAVRTSREDDNTNILCVPGRDFEDEEVKQMIITWLETEFSESDRHKRRLEKITKIEKDN